MSYLRAHPQHLPTFLTHQRIRQTPVGGGSISDAFRLTLDDGTSLFAKGRPDPMPETFFEVEAAGLRWLGAAGGVPVPEVLVALPDLLALEWIEPGAPTADAARRLGAELAVTHLAGAPAFGALPGHADGFIGALPQDDTPSPGPWGPWFADRRLRPHLRRSVDNGALDAAAHAAVARVLDRIEEYGGDEPPSRIHGDLWPGNVLWGADGRAWLIDPAAHGGHRETDLAALLLFGGVPEREHLISGYAERAAALGRPLDAAWRTRVPLHQLHLLLVHTALFGAAYRAPVRAAADAMLRL
ncbi:fructosamine-3-kinase [Catenuloplanes atrovinosus]|uniref:Fructosamine-3-kinase n=2 Tax=Catenuloplanes atrovinosus TaxID=137266 RepID=A0AAE4CD98_9ACTN|nr:fructosamine-3-kinase [Catenuloplanes atrovinosus]